MFWKVSAMRPAFYVIVVLMGVSAGCVSLRRNSRATCEWLEVVQTEGLVASGARQLTTDHWGAHSCGTVDTFKVERGSYTFEMWNGHQTDPWLFLRAVDGSGTSLRLEATEIQSTSVGGSDVYRDKGMEFSYVFRAHALIDRDDVPKVFPYKLDVRVVSPDGVELGRESLTLVKKAGHYYFREI